MKVWDDVTIAKERVMMVCYMAGHESVEVEHSASNLALKLIPVSHLLKN